MEAMVNFPNITKKGVMLSHDETILIFSSAEHRLLRQYFQKGTDLSIYNQAKLSAVARQLNYETPAERFNSCVASGR